MPIYSLNGSYPSELPFRVTIADGFTRTNPDTFTPEELEEWGYIGPIEVPDYDPSTEARDWDSEAVAFVVRPLTEAELTAIAEANKPPAEWSAFFDALLVSDVFAVARQAAAESLPANAAYTDLAAGLGLAKQGYPNIPAIQAGFKAILALLELTEEQEVELTGLIVSHNIPISLD